MTPDDQMHYCIHIRATLDEGKGDHPPPFHVWSGSLTADILQEACPEDWIMEAVVLLPGEAILFFRRHSLNRDSSMAMHRMLSLA